MYCVHPRYAKVRKVRKEVCSLPQASKPGLVEEGAS